MELISPAQLADVLIVRSKPKIEAPATSLITRATFHGHNMGVVVLFLPSLLQQCHRLN